jgi:flagellar basal body-associated protein FliL
MTTAIIVIVIVIAILVGTIMSFRNSAKTGMPSEDVLKRATQRARELEAQEKAEDKRS